MTLLLTNAELVDPERDATETGALLIQDGVIAGVYAGAGAVGVPTDVPHQDCGGAVLAPAPA